MALVACAVVFSAPTGWLPGLANALLREYLRVRDLSAVQVRVARLTPWHLRASVRVGAVTSFSRIDRVDLRFSPSGLARKRIDRIDVDGGLVQFRAVSNGVAVCGLPEGVLPLVWSSQSPSGETDADTETASEAHRWQVGRMVLDSVTLRLLPSDSQTDPFEMTLHASAVSDGQETRFAISDFGRVGAMIDGAIRPDCGDGWMVAVLPESDVQEWMRLARWGLNGSRFRDADLCAGRGGVTALARMQDWKPTCAQADLSLRATTRTDEISIAYDLRAYATAEWKPDSGRPTVQVHADVTVRSAACAAWRWADDNGTPAIAEGSLSATPSRDDWDCRFEGRAAVSRVAVASFVPPESGFSTDALRLRYEGAFRTSDWMDWTGSADGRVVFPRAQFATGEATGRVGEMVAHLSAGITNSGPAALRGWLDLSGLHAATNGAWRNRADLLISHGGPDADRPVSVTAPDGFFAATNREPLAVRLNLPAAFRKK